MLSKQLAQLPKEQQEKVLAAFEQNPDFFKGLIGEIGERLKKGESQQSAIMSVMTAHKAELERILKP